MGKKHLQDVKKALFLVIFTAILLAAQSALAIDILEIRVKRLYKEAEMLAEKGDYGKAIETYDKAIGLAKDRDIKQFLINAKKEAQKKRRQERGKAEVSPSKEKTKSAVTEKVISGVSPEQKSSVEKTRFEEEKAKLEAERKKLEEEKAQLEEEKARLEKEKTERQTEPKEESKANVEEMKAKLEEKKPEAEAESAELEKRKEREARDRAIYESTKYRYQIKDILNSARNKLRETTSRAEEEETLKRTKAKIDELTTLDQQAEDLMSRREYEKARETYKKILEMSKDTDLKEYIKRGEK